MGAILLLGAVFIVGYGVVLWVEIKRWWKRTLLAWYLWGLVWWAGLLTGLKQVIKPKDPRELAIAMMSRSVCNVQVGAVLADSWGIFSWGHNSSGFSGYGEHAEAHCLRRSNRRRVKGSTLYVAARRQRNSRPVTAKPCERCLQLITRCKHVTYRDGDGVWQILK